MDKAESGQRREKDRRRAKMEFSAHYDSRIRSAFVYISLSSLERHLCSVKPVGRKQRNFRFHRQGAVEAVANRERIKARLEKLRSEIESTSKKTGISSAVKLAVVAPKTAQVVSSPEFR